MRRLIGAAAAALLLAGCKTTATRLENSAQPATQSVDQLAAAIAADSRRSEVETDSKIRDQLAADANRDALSCVELAPQSAACLYYRGIALGLDARAHPLHANDALKHMLESLTQAEAIDPEFRSKVVHSLRGKHSLAEDRSLSSGGVRLM